jgi:hypothetical protein
MRSRHSKALLMKSRECPPPAKVRSVSVVEQEVGERGW